MSLPILAASMLLAAPSVSATEAPQPAQPVQQVEVKSARADLRQRETTTAIIVTRRLGARRPTLAAPSSACPYQHLRRAGRAARSQGGLARVTRSAHGNRSPGFHSTGAPEMMSGGDLRSAPRLEQPAVAVIATIILKKRHARQRSLAASVPTRRTTSPTLTAQCRTSGAPVVRVAATLSASARGASADTRR